MLSIHAHISHELLHDMPGLRLGLRLRFALWFGRRILLIGRIFVVRLLWLGSSRCLLADKVPGPALFEQVRLLCRNTGEETFLYFDEEELSFETKKLDEVVLQVGADIDSATRLATLMTDFWLGSSLCQEGRCCSGVREQGRDVAPFFVLAGVAVSLQR